MNITKIRLKVTRGSTEVFTTTDLERKKARDLHKILAHKFSSIDKYSISVICVQERRQERSNYDRLMAATLEDYEVQNLESG